jgi:DNA-directed RNA polymerase specialized sigma24 family protein
VAEVLDCTPEAARTRAARARRRLRRALEAEEARS